MLPPVINERLRLSIDAPPAHRAFGVVFGLVFSAMGAAFVLMPLLAERWMGRVAGDDDECTYSGDLSDLPSEFQELCEPDGGFFDGGFFDDAGFGPMRFIGLCGVPFVLIGLYLALRVLRTAAWLDGTRASVRGAFGTRTVDLAGADVSAGAITYRHGEDTMHERVERVPTIVARDRATGRRVTIPLRAGDGANLPPHELRALADAMSIGRSTDGRDADVLTLAGQLRTMAGNPLGF